MNELFEHAFTRVTGCRVERDLFLQKKASNRVNEQRVLFRCVSLSEILNIPFQAQESKWDTALYRKTKKQQCVQKQQRQHGMHSGIHVSASVFPVQHSFDKYYLNLSSRNDALSNMSLNIHGPQNLYILTYEDTTPNTLIFLNNLWEPGGSTFQRERRSTDIYMRCRARELQRFFGMRGH